MFNDGRTGGLGNGGGGMGDGPPSGGGGIIVRGPGGI